MIDSYPTFGSRKSVLVLDDEESLRRLARRMLEGAGYDVYEAGTGGEAVDLARKTPGLGLLISDVVLPGMSAAAAWQAISLVCPEARVLFTSGYTGDQLAAQALLSPRTPLLSKPFTAAKFLAAVRTALAPELTGLQPETQ